MFTTRFWQATAERAVKTAAQFGLTAWGAVTFTKVGEVVNTGIALGLALLFGAVLSVLTSLASINVGVKGTPSLLPKETPNAQ
jgi:uncharacterized membrane protein